MVGQLANIGVIRHAPGDGQEGETYHLYSDIVHKQAERPAHFMNIGERCCAGASGPINQLGNGNFLG